MSLQKLIAKYECIRKNGYETVTVFMVLTDLHHVRSLGKAKN